jgi:hypothetical protein
MVKKTVKQPPHLRVRIHPKLITRLEKAREANGNTLTGEIVSRLEASFETEDKLALIQEQHQEVRRLDAVAARTYMEECIDLRERIEGLNRELNRAGQKKGEAAIVDALLGDDGAAKRAIRAVALLLAGNPGWACTTDGIHSITHGVTEAIKAAANQEAKQ